MRFLYGVIALVVWLWFLDYAAANGAVNITDWQCILSSSIVVAGAMAGGA